MSVFFLFFERGLLDIEDLDGTLSRKEVNDLSDGVGVPPQQEPAVLETGTGDVRFPALQDDHTVLEFTVVERFSVELHLLV